MKTTTLRLLVGVTAPLILTVSVRAGFTGISTDGGEAMNTLLLAVFA